MRYEDDAFRELEAQWFKIQKLEGINKRHEDDLEQKEKELEQKEKELVQNKKNYRIAKYCP